MNRLYLLKRLLLAVIVAGLLLPTTARAALTLNCAFATQKVVLNEFYTGSGSFVEIYFLQQTNISGWGLFLAPDANSVSAVASLGNGSGDAYVPDGSGGFTKVKDNSNGGTFPVGTYITYAVASPNSRAEFLLATVSTTGGLVANSNIVADYFYYNSSNKPSYFSVGSACGAYLLDHATSQQDIARSTDGTGTWTDNAKNTTPGASNSPGGTPSLIRISHDGQGLTCEPDTITLTACANALCTAPHFASPVTVTLNGTGWSANPVTFTGQTTVTLSSTTPQSLTLGSNFTPTQCLNTATAANTCGFTFADAEFKIGTVGAQSAGFTSSGLTITAVEKNTATGTCKGKFNGNVPVEVAARCLDPATCAGKSVVINGTTIGTTSTGNALSYTPLTMNFSGASSTSSYSLRYDDVGEMTFFIRHDLGSSKYMTGTSNNFVVKPYGFTISNLKRSSDNAAPPGSCTSAGCTKWLTAGNGVTSASQMTATVTAIAGPSATTPFSATPNFGKEANPEGVKLGATHIGGDLIANGLIYVDGSSLGLIGGLNLFSNGAASKTNIAWDEAGIMTLTPSVGDGNYLGAGDVTGTATGNIGRFVPGQFAISSGMVTNACTAGATPFTYFGQDGFGSTFTLTAQSLAGNTTRNYNGSYAKLDLSVYANYVFSAATLPGGAALSSGTAAVAGSTWNEGVATPTVKHVISRPAAPDSERTITLSALPADSDGVTMTAAGTIGNALLRFGRLALFDKTGTSIAALAIPVEAQYWDATANQWLKNTADSCTSVPTSAVVLAGYAPPGWSTSIIESAVGTAFVLSAGGANLNLSAPSPARTGRLNVAIHLGASGTVSACTVTSGGTPMNAAYLRSRYGSCGAGTYDKDPAASINFGYFGRQAYRREVYN